MIICEEELVFFFKKKSGHHQSIVWTWNPIWREVLRFNRESLLEILIVNGSRCHDIVNNLGPNSGSRVSLISSSCRC